MSIFPQIAKYATTMVNTMVTMLFTVKSLQNLSVKLFIISSDKININGYVKTSDYNNQKYSHFQIHLQSAYIYLRNN